MANVITDSPGVITIAPDGSTDWVTIRPIIIKTVKFYPNAAGDICIIRDTSASGNIISKFKDGSGYGSHDPVFPDNPVIPCIKGTEGVNGSLVMIIYKM